MNTDRKSSHKILIRSYSRYSRANFLILLAVFAFACSKSDDQQATNAAPPVNKEIADLQAAIRKVEPFFSPMGKPQAYDWLGSHNEPGQTFEQYLDSDPTKPTKERQKIYVLPLGTFSDKETRVIKVVADYLAAFYDLPVQQMSARPLPVPRKDGDIRTTSTRGVANPGKQYRAGFIMDSSLKPLLPKDAAALIAFTHEDLYPDATMSYVFGQASMQERVGVWSLFRLQQNANYDTFLQRTLKIAAHETGHMFSMWHCTKYECVMSGSNYLGETDRRPIDACPECMAKICWLSDISPKERYKKLAAFAKTNGLKAEAADFEKKLAAMQ